MRKFLYWTKKKPEREKHTHRSWRKQLNMESLDLDKKGMLPALALEEKLRISVNGNKAEGVIADGLLRDFHPRRWRKYYSDSWMNESD